MGLRIGFMGTPDFAAHALAALIESEHEIICAYSQPPRPKGRGHKVQKSPVHQLAETHNIDVFTPQNFKNAQDVQTFANHNLDIAIVAAYGLILPEEILNAPAHGCINIHASLLPRWRGASPIQHAIWKGDEETGVTIMQMDKGLDTGPMIIKDSCSITVQTTARSLHDDLADMGAKLSLETLKTLERDGRLNATPQDDGQSTYAPLLKKSDGDVNWNDSASDIDRQIRALNPWPGVKAQIQGQAFKIKSASLSRETTDQPAGTLLNKNGDIACGDGTVLRLNTIQPAGKKPMDFASAINGGYISL